MKTKEHNAASSPGVPFSCRRSAWAPREAIELAEPFRTGGGIHRGRARRTAAEEMIGLLRECEATEAAHGSDS